MKFEGEIGELDLLSRLVELGRERFTGAFRFESDSVIKIIYLKQGDILSASTNDRTDSIDEILLKAGKVTKEHVRQALAKRKETETLGDALLNLGFITKKELTWARRVQLIGIIRSIQKWTNGSWTLVADYLPKREEGTVFPLRQVILELVLTEQGREKLDRDIANGDAVFTRTPLFAEEYPSLGLNQEADGILQAIDGSRTAAEIAATAPTDEFNVYKLLQALSILGLVERAGEPQVEPEVSAPPPMDDYDLDFSESSFPAAEEQPRFDAATVPAAAIPGYTEEVDLRDVGAIDATEEVPAFAPIPDVAPVEAQPAPTYAAVASSPEAAPKYSFEDQPMFPEEAPSISPDSVVPPEPERARSTAPRSRATVSMPLSKPRRRSRMPLIAALVLLVIGAAGFAAWRFYFVPAQEAPVATTLPSHVKKPAPAAPAAAPTSLTTETQPQTTATTATSAPVQLTPPAASPVAAPATTTSSAPPATTTVATAPATPVPSKATTPAVAIPTSAAQAKYAEMARKWAAEPGSGYTVQFELVCRPESIAKAITIGGANIWFVPTSYRGGTCYRVFWGRYSTKQEAESGAGQIPSSLRESKPAVISVQSLSK